MSESKVVQFDNSIPLLVLLSALGARAFYVLSNPEMLSRPELWIQIQRGGMVSYGGLLGVWLGLTLWGRQQKWCLWETWDQLVPVFAIAWALGRFGCLLTWYGEEGVRGSGWGVWFRLNGQLFHPALLYQIVLLLMLGIILWRVDWPTGRLACLGLGMFALVRWVVDQFRYYPVSWNYWQSQALCCLLLIAAFKLEGLRSREDFGPSSLN